MTSMLDRMVAAVLPAIPRPIVQRVSSRYIAGENAPDAIAQARRLESLGLRTTMDILGEHVESRPRAEHYTSLYLKLIAEQAAAGIDRNVSIKLSQVGLQLDLDFCRANLRSILDAAGGQTKVRIDMEDSTCTDHTLALFRQLSTEYDNLGIVLQAYLHRTLTDIEEMAALGADYRLCKGIYIESAEVALQDPAEINRNFIAALRSMWDKGSYVGIATHDDDLVDQILAIIETESIGQDRYEFQMLLGVQESLRDRILHGGHPLRIYLPFGEEWYAYSVRRLRENPSIAGHVIRGMLPWRRCRAANAS